MMERFIIWKRFSLVRVLLLAGLLGCVHDKLDGPDQLGKVIDIELVIPGFEVPLTRSIEGDNGEAAVRELDLLFFDQSTPSAKLFRHLNVIDFRQESSGADYKGEFYQFNLSSCIRQQNSLTAQFVSFSLSNLANIFYPPQFLQ